MDREDLPANVAERLGRRPLLPLPEPDVRRQLERLGRVFLDLTLETMASSPKRPPLPQFPAGGGSLPLGDRYEPPAEGRSADRLIETLREKILPYTLNVGSPGYAGHMDTIGSAIGAFSDMLVSALNNNMLCWELAPVFTQMESQLLGWITEAIGWDRRSATGFLVSGGSLANLSALLAARNQKIGPLCRSKGLAAAPGPPVVLASEEAHYSIDKIANVLGLGSQGLVRVATDERLRMDPAALEAAIERERRKGNWPFCVVGIAGTTVNGSIDPLPEIGRIARREGLWLHVDAAYGGSLLVCGEGRHEDLRELLRGMEMADSVTFNPQKWLFVPKVCAGVFFREAEAVADAVRQTFPYAGSHSEGVLDPRRNIGEYTIQGTRRVDVLKLWLTLEHFGLDLLADLIDLGIERARWFASEVRRSDELELLCEPQLNIVCFRYRRKDASGGNLDTLNARIHEALAKEGSYWVSLPRHASGRWLRLVILHPLTGREVLSGILKRVVELGRSLGGAC